MIRNRSIVNAVVGFIALVAFIFFLLCTISTPIVQSIYLFRASTTSTNANAHIQFGTFGGCGTTNNFRTSRVTSSPFGSLLCTPTELSYEIITSEPYQDPSGSFSSRPSVLVDHNTTSALILNPIACGLAGLVMILAPIAALLSGRVIHSMTTIATGLATLIAWAAFGVNTAIIVKVRSGLQSNLMGIYAGSTTFKFTWGAVMPLSLVAAVLLSVALVISALSFFLGDQPPRYEHSYGTGARKEMGRGSTSTY